MNKDQVKGTAKQAAGKVQEGAGKMVGSREQEAKGLGKQAAGKVQKSVGDAKEAVKSPTRHH
ncbi:MAG: CsbD family protein [Burkholderiaceae bacterium]